MTVDAPSSAFPSNMNSMATTAIVWMKTPPINHGLTPMNTDTERPKQLVATDVRRLTSRSRGRLEPPHVGCYELLNRPRPSVLLTFIFLFLWSAVSLASAATILLTG